MRYGKCWLDRVGGFRDDIRFSKVAHRQHYQCIVNRIRMIDADWQFFHIGSTAINIDVAEANDVDVLVSYPLSQSVLDVMQKLQEFIRTPWEVALLPYISAVASGQYDQYHFRLWVYPQGHEIVHRLRRFVTYLKAFPRQAAAYGFKKQCYSHYPDYSQLKAHWIRSIDQQARHVLPDVSEPVALSSKTLTAQEQMVAMQQTRLIYKSFMPYYIPDMQFSQTTSFIKVSSPYQDAALNYMIHIGCDAKDIKTCMATFNESFVEQSAVWYLAPFALDFAWYRELAKHYGQTDQYIGCVHDIAQSKIAPTLMLLQGFHFERVLTEKQIDIYYGLRPEWCSFAKSVKQMGLQLYDPIELYIGYFGGKPVATISFVITSGVVGLYGLQVSPMFRRRGLGRHIIEWAVREAQQRGGRYVMCQVGAASRGIARCAGFKSLCQYIEYGVHAQSKITLPA